MDVLGSGEGTLAPLLLPLRERHAQVSAAPQPIFYELCIKNVFVVFCKCSCIYVFFRLCFGLDHRLAQALPIF